MKTPDGSLSISKSGNNNRRRVGGKKKDDDEEEDGDSQRINSLESKVGTYEADPK